MTLSRYRQELFKVTEAVFKYHQEEKLFAQYKQTLEGLGEISQIEKLVLEDTYKHLYQSLDSDKQIKKHLKDLLFMMIKLYKIAAAVDYIKNIEDENELYKREIEKHIQKVSHFRFEEKKQEFVKLNAEIDAFSLSLTQEIQAHKLTNSTITTYLTQHEQYADHLQELVKSCKNKTDHRTEINSLDEVASKTIFEMNALLHESKQEEIPIFLTSEYASQHEHLRKLERTLTYLKDYYREYSTLLDEKNFISHMNNVGQYQVDPSAQRDKPLFDQHLKIDTIINSDKEATTETLKKNAITSTINKQYSWFSWYTSYVYSNQGYVVFNKLNVFSNELYALWYGLNETNVSKKDDPNITACIKKLLAQRDALKQKYNLFLKNELSQRREIFHAQIELQLRELDRKNELLKKTYRNFCSGINSGIRKKLSDHNRKQIESIIKKCNAIHLYLSTLPDRPVAILPKQKVLKEKQEEARASSSRRGSLAFMPQQKSMPQQTSRLRTSSHDEADEPQDEQPYLDLKDEDILAGNNYREPTASSSNQTADKRSLTQTLLFKQNPVAGDLTGTTLIKAQKTSSHSPERIKSVLPAKTPLLAGMFTILLGTAIAIFAGPVGWAIGGLFILSGLFFVKSSMHLHTDNQAQLSLQKQNVPPTTQPTPKPFEIKARKLGLDPKKGVVSSNAVSFRLRDGRNLKITNNSCKLFSSSSQLWNTSLRLGRQQNDSSIRQDRHPLLQHEAEQDAMDVSFQPVAKLNAELQDQLSAYRM